MCVVQGRGYFDFDFPARERGEFNEACADVYTYRFSGIYRSLCVSDERERYIAWPVVGRSFILVG